MESQKTYPPLAAESPDRNFKMIDVGEKVETRRRAVAQGRIRMAPETLRRVREKSVPKGDVLALAEVAGILAAKKTGEILPLCHPLGLDAVQVSCRVDESDSSVLVLCEAITHAKTGVEMEALLGVNAALLCIYDLVKAIDPVLTLGDIYLRTKEGGKSGHWVSPLVAESEPAAAQAKGASPQVTGFEGLKAGVITVSDRCSRGEAQDLSGGRLSDALIALGVESVARGLVADDQQAIVTSVKTYTLERPVDLLLMTGGTGLGPRDITPEALEPLWSRKIPGIGELLRSSGARHHPMAWLSRSQGGFIGETLVIALPGSSKAVLEGLDALQGMIPHLIEISRGGRH